MPETKVMNNDVSSCSRPTLAAYTKGEKQWELRVLHLRLFPGDNGSSHDKPKSGMRSIHVFVSSNNFGISFGRKEKRSKQLSVESTCFLAGNFVNHHLIMSFWEWMGKVLMNDKLFLLFFSLIFATRKKNPCKITRNASTVYAAECGCR